MIVVSGGTSSTRHSGAEMPSCTPLQKPPTYCTRRSLRPQHQRRHWVLLVLCGVLVWFVFWYKSPGEPPEPPPLERGPHHKAGKVVRSTGGGWVLGRNGRLMKVHQERGHLRRGVGCAMGSVSGWSRWRAFLPMALVLLSSSGLVCADFEIGGHFVETAQSSAISPRTGWWAAPVHSKIFETKTRRMSACLSHLETSLHLALLHPLAFWCPVFSCLENCSHV